MFSRIALLADEAGDGDKGGGGGAPAGGSPEGGQGKGSDDEKQKFEQRIRAALAEQKRTLQAEFDAKLAEATKQRQDPPKRYTKAQLNAAVQAGEISQEQADQQWELQVHQEAEGRAERVAREVVSAERSKEVIDSEIARYQGVAPEIMDDSHETRQKIQAEYSYQLRTLGQPKGAATQLAAIRAVLGPIDNLERARSGRFKAEHHEETGGGGGGGSREQRKTGKLVDQLNADSKKHYERQIERGLYLNWDAVEAELKFASPGVRQRLGLA